MEHMIGVIISILRFALQAEQPDCWMQRRGCRVSAGAWLQIATERREKNMVRPIGMTEVLAFVSNVATNESLVMFVVAGSCRVPRQMLHRVGLRRSL